MSKPTVPCKDCSERHVGCHGYCERYFEFKKELSEFVSEVNVKYYADCASSYFLRGKRERFRAFGKGRKG